MKPLTIFFVTLIAIAIIASVAVYTVPAFGVGTGTSDLPVSPGCSAKKIPMSIKGEVSVKQKLLSFEPRPYISKVTAVQVAQSYYSLLATKYEVKIAVVQDGKVVAITNLGDDIQTFFLVDKLFYGKTFPYKLTLNMPDNDCDGEIDPFSAKLVATLTPSGQVEQQFEQSLFYKDGEVTIA